MDIGDTPQQMGVVLVLEPAAGFDPERARTLIAERVGLIPRLSQRLVHAPLGCGGPYWVDDPRFDIAEHVRVVGCPEPGDERALLEHAESTLTRRLPLNRPLWSVEIVPDLRAGRVALVVVLHHLLADGVGGLTVLAALVDHGPAAPPRGCPRRPPSRPRLAADALVRRVRSLGRVRSTVRLLRAAMSASGGLHPPRATPCSLIHPAGARRRLEVVRADLAPLAAAAHRHGASTNDALLVAVAGALRQLLLARGERVDRFAVAVPVSGRAVAGPELGNMVGPLLVEVPATGEVAARLPEVAAQVVAGKAAASGPAPIALLGWAFRPLAALGGYHWYINHQRRMHTLVSHVRGPADPVAFNGAQITSAIPIATADNGNLTVCFEVLSYAGTLTITVVADEDQVPDLHVLTDALRAELSSVAAR